MARKREVERAKRLFLSETEHRDWVRGVGIGLVEGRIGLIVNVAPRTKPAASRLLRKLEIDVPTQVRAVPEIRAKVPSKPAETDAFDALRKAAQDRLSGAR